MGSMMVNIKFGMKMVSLLSKHFMLMASFMAMKNIGMTMAN